MKTRLRVTLLFLALAELCVFNSFAHMAHAQSTLLQPSDFSYQGAFRLEENWANDYRTWEYSNAPLAYYPAGDPNGASDGYPGSLFVAAHVYRSRVAELSIPTPVNSRSLSALNTARILQPMTDVAATISNKNGFIMGMTYIPASGRFYFTHGSDYSDGDCEPSGSPPGLGSFSPNLSNPQSQGLSYVSLNGTRLHPFTSLRYIMEIPEPWATSFGGRSVAMGRHRGWCPEGTNLFAAALPGTLPIGGDVPVAPLMYFGRYDEPSKWSKEHGGANAYQGGVLATADGKSSVLTTGIIDYDISRSYYGYANWTFPNQCEPTGTCVGGRGWRAADPRTAFLFYNPQDLADVAKGLRQSWDVAWYAKLDITPHMYRRYEPTMLTTGSDAENILVTFDRARGILYVSESFVDGPRPVIHVFKIGGTAGTTPPAAPSGLSVR